MAQTMNLTQSKMIGEQLLKHLFRYRRLLSDTNTCTHQPCPICLAPHLQKVQFFIEHNEPLHFILPAFPAKSPNPQKVLGPMPDMGERVALQFLQSLCDRIREIYAPGAKLTICSDGRVFNELVAVSDENVTLYSQRIQALLNEIKADAIDVFNLEDMYTEMSFDEMRKTLIELYAQPIETIQKSVKNEEQYRQMFNGIHRFLFEDYLVLEPHKSRNKIRVECKARAYEVIQRSHAWSALIAKLYPKSLRLSIHPQPYHSEKIGIHTIKTLDRWGTPWHNATVFDGEKFMLMKRSYLESMGASLVWHNGHPSHYVWSEQKSQPLVTVAYQEVK
ncbi:isocyanide synthase family protein [Nostoc sp. FACHB-888]|uniref:L-tyrosine/L-tryptophan isonitrile synthase family protein n=1 Tax=Nostoc sp. FACHB-888 TaxID=2692842 RepID=UPI00168500F0|nr:isocyanide synthase family protein [Nostoc sp. FACHB-888]MBD2247778.1 L-tyrosine/L-tryptophan isonitrile synthase family protein [Nostoc sp. FACHB-888]